MSKLAGNYVPELVMQVLFLRRRPDFWRFLLPEGAFGFSVIRFCLYNGFLNAKDEEFDVRKSSRLAWADVVNVRGI